MSELALRIEEAVEREAGLHVVVEEDESTLVLTGMVESEEERQAVLDIAHAVAGGRFIDDNIEVSSILPEEVEGQRLSEVEVGGFRGAEPQTEAESSIEPGDFTDQEVLKDPLGAPGATRSQDDDMAEGNTAYIPPTDPVYTRQGDILGGFATTSMDEMKVEPSAQGALPGDEAIADAVRSELREDASTSDLELRVTVRGGVVHLRGNVPMILDAENAESVAGRVPGVREVLEDLFVEELEQG